MFLNREELLRSLEKVRSRLCCYVGSENFCDCKFGPQFKGEHTGCPEVRIAMRILKLIPKEQFDGLLEKAEGFYGTIEQD